MRAVPTIGATAVRTPRTSLGVHARLAGSAEVERVRDRRRVDRDQRRDPDEHQRSLVQVRRLDRIRRHACQQVEDRSLACLLCHVVPPSVSRSAVALRTVVPGSAARPAVWDLQSEVALAVLPLPE